MPRQINLDGEEEEPRQVEATYEATRQVLASSDHYRAKRFARILLELAEDEAFPDDVRDALAADRELVDGHVQTLKKGSR